MNLEFQGDVWLERPPITDAQLRVQMRPRKWMKEENKKRALDGILRNLQATAEEIVC